MDHETVNRILNADATDLEAIVRAVETRYCQLFPNWEVSFVSLEKGKDRSQQLERIIELLMQMKELD